MFREAVYGLVGLSVMLSLPDTAVLAQVADESPVVSELRERLTNFFGSLRDRRTQEAYADLLVDSQLAKPDRQTQREQLIKKTVELESVYGRARGYELIQAQGRRRSGAVQVSIQVRRVPGGVAHCLLSRCAHRRDGQLVRHLEGDLGAVRH